MSVTRHPQVTISHDSLTAEVDEGIAPLIRECWRAGLETSSSCQDNLGRVWIQFLFADDAERFLSIVAGGYDSDVESLYNRIGGDIEPRDSDAFRRDRAWSYTAHVYDLAVDADEHGYPVGPHDDGPVMHVILSVRFPISDYPDVLGRLTAFNRGASGRYEGHRDRRRRAVVHGRPRLST